jgi:MFS family permease
LYILCFTLLSVMNSGVSSSLPSNAVPYIFENFNIDDESQSSLPTSVFLLGYVVGPLIWSPLSETIGRRPILVYTFIVFFLSTLACALAPNWPSLLFFRFVCGCMGASPQTVIGGVYADIFEARARGRVMAFYMAVRLPLSHLPVPCSHVQSASFGPILGPIISGFASQHGWRWTFWADLIFAAVALSGLLFIPGMFCLAWGLHMLTSNRDLWTSPPQAPSSKAEQAVRKRDHCVVIDDRHRPQHHIFATTIYVVI